MSLFLATVILSILNLLPPDTGGFFIDITYNEGNMKQQTKQRDRVLTGLRANSSLTIGNYLGAVLPMVQLSKKHKDTHDFFMFVPDLHSFTTPINHDELFQNTLDNVKLFVATGAVDLKNEHTFIYRQSHIPAHSELTWILDCFAHMGELSRMTQFKDKAGLSEDVAESSQLLEIIMERTKAFSNRLVKTVLEHDLKKVIKELKNESISVGLFNYPVLMAADILLYNAKYVPLGDDQRQHLELTRDLAQRVNERFKDVFVDGVFQTIPLDWKKQLAFSGRDQGLRIRSLRNPAKKMSKSDSELTGSITLTEAPAKAAKKIMAATTDSDGVIRFDWKRQPGITNLLQILALLSDKDIQEVTTDWQGKTRYGDLKQAVAKQVTDFLEDFQKKLAAVNDQSIINRLEADEAKVAAIANNQLLRVQQAAGLRARP